MALSRWSAVVLLVGLVASLLLWRPTSRRLGWVPLPTLASYLLVTGVAALTLGPGHSVAPGGLRACVRRAPRQLDRTVDAATPSLETLLNLAMLAPLGIALVLAVRRVLPVLAILLALPGVIEVVQTRIPGRLCSGVDYVTNLSGGLVGAAVGAVLLLASRTVRRRRPG